MAVQVGPEGPVLLVCDSLNNRVEALRLDNAHTVGSLGRESPQHLSVRVFSQTYVSAGERGATPGAFFTHPYGVSVGPEDPQGRVAVADTGNSRVQVSLRALTSILEQIYLSLSRPRPQDRPSEDRSSRARERCCLWLDRQRCSWTARWESRCHVTARLWSTSRLAVLENLLLADRSPRHHCRRKCIMLTDPCKSAGHPS
mgnify:CR=1 FL=1|jgi:hypothetical protein